MDAGLDRRQRHLVLVMDVGDHRDRRARHDLGEALGRLLLVAGATDDVAPGRRQRVDLLQRALDVGRLGDRHRLHRDRRPTHQRAHHRRGSASSTTFGAPVGDFHDKTDATAHAERATAQPARPEALIPSQIVAGKAREPELASATSGDPQRSQRRSGRNRADGLGDVEVQAGDEQEHQHRHHGHRERHHLGDVGVVALAVALAHSLVRGDRGVAAVERQQREHVEHADEHVEHGEQVQDADETLRIADVVADRR